MEKRKIFTPEWEAFLRNEGLLERAEANANAYYDHGTIEHGDRTLSIAFSWSRYPEEHAFWREVHNRFSKERSGITFLGDTWYGMNDLDQLPKVGASRGNAGDYSDDILIDIDGNREHYRVGWWSDFPERGTPLQHWHLHDDVMEKHLTENLKWQMLPLKIYDK